MKTTKELEDQLIKVGRELSAISVEIGRSEITYYRDNEAFKDKLVEYKNCFEKLYRASEKESYFWLYCSFTVYKGYIEKELESRSHLSLESLSTYLYDLQSELVIPDQYPILTDREFDVGLSDYPFYLMRVDKYFYSDWQLQKDLRRDMYKKQEYIQHLRDGVSNRLSSIREKEKIELKRDTDNYLNSLLPPSEEEVKRQENINTVEMGVRKNSKTIIENNVRIASNLLSVMGYCWFNGEKIMDAKEYVRMKDEVEKMVATEELPNSIVTLKKVNATNKFIKKLFWYIVRDVENHKSFREIVIRYVLKKFEQFNAWEYESLYRKFAEYDGNFEKDYNLILKRAGVKTGYFEVAW